MAKNTKRAEESRASAPSPTISHFPPRRAERLKDFAASLGISYDSAFRAARAGTLRTVRFGKSILIPADEAERVAREGL